MDLKKEHLIPVINKDEEHRGTIESTSALFTNNGFKVERYFEERMEMKFLDGSAFLNHYFVKLGWLSSWLGLFPKEELEEIFTTLELNLNSYAAQMGGLTLTVPMAYIEGLK